MPNTVETQFKLTGVEAALRQLKEYEAALGRITKMGTPGGGFGGFGSGGGGISNIANVASALPGGNILSSFLTGGISGGTTSILTETINQVKNLTTALFDLSKSAVSASADFEKSVNAMTVFTGSTAAARVELAGLAELAKNTPGLRLLDAEEGAARLRALNFSAETTQNLIVGLAKQKLFSGADEGAISRTIINLTQLKAGSPQIGRDIQQIVLSLPSAINVINSAFGSIEQFKKAIKDNPDTAINQFAEAMKNAQGISGGFADALGKLQDAGIRALRALSEPSLRPLTDGAKELTTFLDENEDTWKRWGVNVGDTLRGVMEEYRAFKNLVGDGQNRPENEEPTFLDNALSLGADLTSSGVSIGVRYLRQQGRASRLAEPVGIQMGLNFEKATKDANEYALKTAKEQFKNQNEIAKEGYKLSETLLSQHLTKTRSEQVTQLQAVNGLRQNFLNQQLAAEKDYYQRQLINAGDNEEKKTELLEEFQTSATKINLEIFQNEAETQKKILELQKQIIEERKKAQVQIQDQATNLLSLRTGDPFVQFYADYENSIRNFNETFKDATNQQKQAFAELTREILRTKVAIQEFENVNKARDLRNQAFNLGGLLPSEIGGRPRRLGFLGDALSAITGAAGYRQQALSDRVAIYDPFGRQNIFGNNEILKQLFGFGATSSRIDSIAGQFGNLGIQGQALIAQSKLGLLPGSSDLINQIQQFGQNSIAGRYAAYGLSQRAGLNDVLAQAEEQKLSDTLFRNQFFTQQLNRYQQDLEFAQRAGQGVPLGARLDNLLNVYSNIGVENLNAQQLQAYASTFEARARETEKEKTLINDVMVLLKERLTGKGVPVDLGGQVLTEVQLQDGTNAQITKQSSPGRPSNIDSAVAVRNGGSFISGGFNGSTGSFFKNTNKGHMGW